MSEERIQQLETTVNEHSQAIRGINVALSEITETMKAFASGIVELRDGQQIIIETQRTTLETVGRLTNTVGDLAQTVDNLAQTVDNLVTQEVPSLNAAVERLERIVDYLIRRDNERNGN